MRRVTDNGIIYELTIKAVKNINLRVRADGTVAVSASRRVKVSVIDAFVAANAEKIRLAQERLRQARERDMAVNVPPSDGAVIRILGNDVVIRVEESGEAGVIFDEYAKILHIRVREGEKSASEMIGKLYESWRRGYAREVFEPIMAEVHGRFARFGVKAPILKIREMKTRWGSCIPAKGVVTLNLRLLAYPESVITYVAVHEFCHFLEPNHSPAFYRLMDTMLPEWREEKAKLK